jgi:hypothetical protein
MKRQEGRLARLKQNAYRQTITTDPVQFRVAILAADPPDHFQIKLAQQWSEARLQSANIQSSYDPISSL